MIHETIRFRRLLYMFLCGVWMVSTARADQGKETLLRAFPGAEGFGACVQGGRGGAVLFVTTLEDYLPGKEQPIPGSLRAALTAEGPRYVLFRVGGTISLKTDLWITNPCVTIAGQTAPGDGVCVKDYQVVVATHDVIVRHVRIRSGDLTRKEQMAVGIFGGNNSILDHCSMTWAIDEVMSSFGAVHNVTVQWSIISEGLSRSFHPKGEHSKGSILGGDGGMTLHHCLYAHNSARNPRVNTILLDFRNNVIYDWGYRCAYTREAPCYVNWVANYLKPGPSTTKSAAAKIFDPGDDMARVFLKDNVLVGFEKETRDNSLMALNLKLENFEELRKTIVVREPFLSVPLPTDSAERAYERVLAEAGATLPQRDSADERLMREVRTGTGKILDSTQEAGGWPNLQSGQPPADSDNDGMPDEWERKHQLGVQDPKDNLADADGDGYPNLEEYLNRTAPRSPEKDCRVEAAPFREIQKKALDLAAQGTAEWARRENAAKKKNEENRKQIIANLKVTFKPEPGPGVRKIVLDLGNNAELEMALIPAGSFLMGSPESEEGLEKERPQHKVNISRPFYMAATLTTTRQFLAVMGPDARTVKPGEDLDLPAHETTWFEATDFCDILSATTGKKFRLPTEAEWEYACRAGTATAFNTGETITTDQANFNGLEATRFNPAGVYRGKKTPVKMFPPNAWGLYDMHGNESEYCQDVAFRKYTNQEVTDPISQEPAGPDEDSDRVMRGGKMGSKAFFIRSAYRYCYGPDVGYGFRAIMEIPN